MERKSDKVREKRCAVGVGGGEEEKKERERGETERVSERWGVRERETCRWVWVQGSAERGRGAYLVGRSPAALRAGEDGEALWKTKMSAGVEVRASAVSLRREMMEGVKGRGTAAADDGAAA
ncbi:hypothetical protein AAC387_Pa09g0658 [Persea americana]